MLSPRLRSPAIGLAFLIALLLGPSACGSSLVPARQGLAMRNVSFPMREMVFPSGLRVIAERDERNPLVALFLVVGAGSTSDPKGKEGIAHYVEHLAFRSRPFGKSSFRRLLERAGAGEWNAFTGLDATVYYEVGPAAGLTDLLRLEGARMLVPVAYITPEVLAVELDVVRSELRQRNETGFVGEVLGSLQGAVFPPDHPYARPVIGTHESLSSIGAEDVEAFLRDHYRPGNMTLVVLGDVDLASIERTVTQALPPALLAAPAAAPAPVKAGRRLPERAPEPPEPPPGGLARKEGSVATPELWIAWSLPRAFDADAYLAELTERAAREALAGATREDQDIAFVSTLLVPGKDASMLVCRAVLNRASHPERSLDHVLNRLHHVWSASQDATTVQVNEIEFGSRKRSAIVGMLLEAESLTARGVARATTAHFTQDPTTYTRAFKSVATLEQARVVAYARRYLGRERARAVLFTPPAGGGALPDALPMSAPALDEEDPLPIRVDVARLRAVSPPPPVGEYRKISLPNGLQVILGWRVGLPIASVGLLLRGGLGGTDDPAAARVAYMLGKPRETWHGDPEVFGGQMGRALLKDKTLYTMDGAAGNVGIMLAILAERVRSMKVDPGSWAPFKRDFVPYLRLAEQKQEVIAGREFLARLFGSHPYGRTPTGKDVEESSTGAAQAWIDATYTPDNAVLAVVGEIDLAEVEKIVREQFQGWSGRAGGLPPDAPPAPSTRPPAAPEMALTYRPGATQAQIQFGCVLPPVRMSAVEARHDVAAQLAGDRLGQILRQRLGVTYGTRAVAWALRGGVGYLEVTGAVERDKLGVSLKVLRETLQGLADAPASANELAWAKLRLARGRSTTYTANSEIVSALLAHRNMGFDIESLGALADEIAVVTEEEVQRAFQLCAAGRPTLSLVGDEPALQAALKEAWP